MAYSNPGWADGVAPAISAANLNRLSDAVAGLKCYPQVSVAEARNIMGLGNTSGALPIANGGTGSTTAADARNNLGITAANLGALPTTGGTISGNLSVTGAFSCGSVNGTIPGNSATSDKFATARTLKVYLSSNDAASFDGSANQNEIGVYGVLPIANGGTGANSGNAGLQGLLAAGSTILSSYQYGTSYPSSAVAGQIFFKKA